MKKIITILSLLFLLNISTVYATTGGPTTVFDLRFDTQTQSIYYTEQSDSGKGCPPELKAISITSNTTKTIFSCDDRYQGQPQGEKIEEFTFNFDSLLAVDLRKNDIHISIEAIGAEKMEDSDWVIKTDFIAHVFQGKVKKASIPFIGCSTRQPFVFDGYRIPDMSNKLVLLLSAKGDCYEGGYIHETVYLVPDVNLIDDNQSHNFKNETPLIPTEGSLVVYTDEDTKENSNMVLILSAVVLLALGLVIGRLSKGASL